MKKLVLLIIVALLASAASADFITLGFVSQDPDPVFAGDTVEVRVSVSNSAKAAVEDRVVEVVADYPFEKVSGEELVKDVGVLKSYQSGDDVKVMKFKFKVSNDVIQGNYDLDVLEYEKGSRDTHSVKTVSIDVKSKESAEIIHIDKVELLPGQVIPVTFTINNVGSAPLRDLTFSWSNEEEVILPVGSDDTKHIKYLDVGESAELVYNVIASSSASPDLYKLTLKLAYDDPLTNEAKEVISSAGVYVGGVTDFDVAYSGSSGGETSFSVSNIGSVPASSVTVSVPKQDNWRVAGSDSVIIGNLDSGDYTIASFSLQSARNFSPDLRVDRTLTNRNELQLLISYTDTRGTRQRVVKTLSVNPRSASAGTMAQSAYPGRRIQTSSPSYTKYIFALVLLVLVYIAYKRYGKFAKKKK